MDQKKNIYAIGIIIAIIIGASGYFVLNQSGAEKMYILKKSESVFIDTKLSYLRLDDFTYSPCPENVVCDWSGLAVHYTLTVGMSVYKSDLHGRLEIESPYIVRVIESDYQTYAKFGVAKREKDCEKITDQSEQHSCWQNKAKELKDITFCYKEPLTQNFCIEEVAGLANDPKLCDKIKAPNKYCLYAKAVQENNLLQCFGILRDKDWHLKCYKDIAAQRGIGVEICDELVKLRSETDDFFTKDNLDRKISDCKNAFKGD